MRGNIITATFDGWETARTSPIFQYDYGQLLQFSDLELPDTYEVQFSDNEHGGSSLTMIGNSGGVEIPDALIANGNYIYAFIFLHSGENDGETEYKITIPVKKRPETEYIEPPQVQQDIITQAIAAINLAADKAETQATAAEESAENAAESASSAADSATASANSATASAGSAQAAATSAENAATAKSGAEAAMQGAKVYSEAASGFADDAEHYADLAGQGAANAGYMQIEMDERGHLIYTRTDAVDVDFSLDASGHLIMEAV